LVEFSFAPASKFNSFLQVVIPTSGSCENSQFRRAIASKRSKARVVDNTASTLAINSRICFRWEERYVDDVEVSDYI